MDLCGVGTRLSPAAFAYHVPDDSLVSVHIHRGDVVLIEPNYRAFRVGNLVLLEIDGQAVLRRLAKINRLWYLSRLDDAGSTPVPLIDQPLQGIAVGFVRLFAPMKPVKFRGADTDCEVSSTRSGYKIATPKKSRVTTALRPFLQTERAKSSQSVTMLAAEKKGSLWLSEIEKEIGYTA